MSVFLREGYASSLTYYHYCTDDEWVKEVAGCRDVKTGQKEVTQWSATNPGEHWKITEDTRDCYISMMQDPLERCQSHGRTVSDKTTDVLPQGQWRGKKSSYMQRWHSSACMCGFKKKKVRIWNVLACNLVMNFLPTLFMTWFICCLWAAANGHAVAVGLGKACYCTRTGRGESKKKPTTKADWKAFQWSKICKR